MVVVDEAAGVSQAIFDAIATLGTGGEYRELLLGNPTSTAGRFYQAFANPALGYICLSIAAADTPNFTGEDVPASVTRNLVTPQWAAERAVEWGEASPLYRARVEAEFPEGDEDNVWCRCPGRRRLRPRDAEKPIDTTGKWAGRGTLRQPTPAAWVAAWLRYAVLKSYPGTREPRVEAWAHRHAQEFANDRQRCGGWWKRRLQPRRYDHLAACGTFVSYEASIRAREQDPRPRKQAQ
jgi:hypothetical protein